MTDRKVPTGSVCGVGDDMNVGIDINDSSRSRRGEYGSFGLGNGHLLVHRNLLLGRGGIQAAHAGCIAARNRGAESDGSENARDKSLEKHCVSIYEL